MCSCYRRCLLLAALTVVSSHLAPAAELTAVRGVVHDPQHRPIAGATVTLRAAYSDFALTEKTNTSGEFSSSAVPPGVYVVSAARAGFNTTTQNITIASEIGRAHV